MNKKISVIIPVYNGEKYINRCVDSVLSQKNFNLDEIEIFLINDGSKDSSYKIILEYFKKYPSIVNIIDQENVGVAKTRNKGIELATGKYIMFIDQDDYIDNDYCRVFYDEIDNNKLDIVVGGYKRPNEYGKNIRIVRQPNTEYSKKYKISAAWAKIHRLNYLKKNNIRFYDNNYGEDIIFTMNENNKTNKIKGINYIGYNWFWNSESVSNTSQRGLKNDIKILRLLNDMSPYVNCVLDEYYIIQTGIHYLLFSGRSALGSNFYKLYKQIFEIFYKNNTAYYKNKFISFGPSGALMSVKISISVFMILHRLNLINLFAKVYCNGK